MTWSGPVPIVLTSSSAAASPTSTPSMSSRARAGRCEDAGLSHAATHPFPDPPRLLDLLGGAEHERTDRCTEPLRQADRHRVEHGAVVAQRYAIGDVRMPDPGAVAVHCDVVGIGDHPECPQGRQRDDGAPGPIFKRMRSAFADYARELAGAPAL